MRSPTGSAFSAPALYQSSTGYFDSGVPGLQPWGRYSTAIVDPNNPRSFWVSNEYVASNWWQTAAARVQLSSTGTTSPAAPTIASPANGSTDTTTAEPAIAGTGVSGDTVTVSIDGTVAGTAAVVNSAWSFTPTSPLSNASHTISATQAAAGGPSSTAATDTFTVALPGSDSDTGSEAPSLGIANNALTVNAGGTVSLGVTATPSEADDVLSLTIAGVPGYETIAAPKGDTVSSAVQEHGTVTWTISETNATGGQPLTGLTLSSTYAGRPDPVAHFTVTASNLTSGENASSAAQALTVTDPPIGAAASSASSPNIDAGLAMLWGEIGHDVAHMTDASTHWDQLLLGLTDRPRASNRFESASMFRS
jgi:Bacterial Ig-like domain